MIQTLFSRLELEDMQRRYPRRDVLKLAAQVERAHFSKRFRDPSLVLETWCRNAERDDTDRRPQTELAMPAYDPPPEFGRRADPAVATAAMAEIRELLDRPGPVMNRTKTDRFAGVGHPGPGLPESSPQGPAPEFARGAS